MNRATLLMLATAGVSVAAGFMIHPLLGIFALGGAVMMGVSIWNGGQKMLAVYRDREGEDFSSFLAALPEVDADVARAVYEEIQATCSSPNHPLPLRPTDHVINDLMLDLEELFAEVLPRIIARIGRGSPEGIEDLTVGGLVRHLSTETSTQAF